MGKYIVGIFAIKQISQHQMQDKLYRTTTVGEFCSGVTGFATSHAIGSHRFLLQVLEEARDEINFQKENDEHNVLPTHVLYNFVLNFHRALSKFQAAEYSRQIAEIIEKKCMLTKINFRVLHGWFPKQCQKWIKHLIVCRTIFISIKQQKYLAGTLTT